MKGDLVSEVGSLIVNEYIGYLIAVFLYKSGQRVIDK